MSRAVAVALALLAAACGNKDAPPSGDKPAPPLTPLKLVYKKLGTLPLEAEMPASARIDDTSQSAGFPTATIYTSPTIFVAGAGDLSDVRATLDATKVELARDPNQLKAITREQTTDDGWILELTRASLSEPGKELYSVSVRRTIDGAAWDCGSTAGSPDERGDAEGLCLSLRTPAPK